MKLKTTFNEAMYQKNLLDLIGDITTLFRRLKELKILGGFLGDNSKSPSGGQLINVMLVLFTCDFPVQDIFDVT